jgi:hypothetical protein
MGASCFYADTHSFLSLAVPSYILLGRLLAYAVQLCFNAWYHKLMYLSV